MNVLSFGPRRKRRLLILLLVFFLVPILALLPFRSIQIVVFLPLLFWINIAGLPLALIGVPYFEVHEFGAVPQGAIGYSLITLVYALAAFFLSMTGKAEDNNSDHE